MCFHKNLKKGFDSLIMWSYNAPPPTVWRHLFVWFVGFKGRTFMGLFLGYLTLLIGWKGYADGGVYAL